MAEKTKVDPAQGSAIHALGNNGDDINTIVVNEVNSKNQVDQGKGNQVDSDIASTSFSSTDDPNDNDIKEDNRGSQDSSKCIPAAIKAEALIGGFPKFRSTSREVCMKWLEISLLTHPLGNFNIRFNHLVGEALCKHSTPSHSHEFFYNNLLCAWHLRNHLIVNESGITMVDKFGLIKKQYLCKLGTNIQVTNNINITRDNLINAGTNAPVIQSSFFNYDTIGNYLSHYGEKHSSPVNFTHLQSVLQLMKSHGLDPSNPMNSLLRKRNLSSNDEPPKKKQRVSGKSKSKNKQIVADTPVFHTQHQLKSPRVVLNADGTQKSGVDIFNVGIGGGTFGQHCNSNSNLSHPIINSIDTSIGNGDGTGKRSKSKSKKKGLPKIPKKDKNKKIKKSNANVSKSQKKKDLLARVTNTAKSKKKRPKVSIRKDSSHSHTHGKHINGDGNTSQLNNYGLFGAAASAIGDDVGGGSNSGISGSFEERAPPGKDPSNAQLMAQVAALQDQLKEQKKLAQEKLAHKSKRERVSKRKKKKSKDKKSRKRNKHTDKLAQDIDRDAHNGGGRYSSRQRVC